MTVKQAVVYRIHELCAANNMAINEFANKAGITPSTVYSVLKPDRKDVGVVTIKKLCDGIDMDFRDFFDSPVFDGLEQEME